MFSRTLRSLEVHELPSYKIWFTSGEEMEVKTCALIVDDFGGTSRKDGVNVRRFRQNVNFRRFATRKKYK